MAANMTTILLELALILVLARLVGYLFSKIGLPPVVGEILAGVLLGPSLLGSDLSEQLFPLDTRPFLTLLANLGLVLFMFVVGLELDMKLIRGRERVAGAVSITSILLPFGLGLLLAAYLAGDHQLGDDFWPFALFIGASMSVTAFPVLARILTDRGMHRTETGGLALACAATDDVLAWTLLAVVIGIGGGEAAHGPGWLVLLAIPFAVLALTGIRSQLDRLTVAYRRAGRLTPGILAVVLVGLLVFSAITELLHVHFIFGAFLWGAIMPQAGAEALRHEILVRLEQLSVLLLLPVFFLISGLNVDLRGLSTENLLQLAAIMAVAVGGKYGGAYLGARLSGVPNWQANSLGILMNTRGLTELVILNVGRELGLLSTELFTMLVVMAILTTVMTGPWLRRAYPDRRVRRDIAEAERAALGSDAATRRVLLVTDLAADNESAVQIGCALVAGREPAELVVAALQTTQKIDLGSGLTDELAAIAASMEDTQSLVRVGESLGVPVRVIAHSTGDAAADLTELASALDPIALLQRDGDPTRDAVAAAVDCPVLVLGDVPTVAESEAVVVAWPGGPDADAAVVAGAQIAAAFSRPLVIAAAEGGSARRRQAMVDALTARGVALAETVHEQVLTLGVPGGDQQVSVRAEVAARPVEWDSVELGVRDPA